VSIEQKCSKMGILNSLPRAFREENEAGIRATSLQYVEMIGGYAA
jgi:hypothetical protein